MEVIAYCQDDAVKESLEYRENTPNALVISFVLSEKLEICFISDKIPFIMGDVCGGRNNIY